MSATFAQINITELKIPVPHNTSNTQNGRWKLVTLSGGSTSKHASS